MTNASATANKKTDKELVEAARAFFSAFAAAAAMGAKAGPITGDNGFSLGAAGFVEINETVAELLIAFISRAEKLLGPSAAHKNAIHGTALKRAHEALQQSFNVEKAAGHIVDGVWDQALTSFQWVSPNRLFRLGQGIAEVKIGRVRAMSTAAFAMERAGHYPNEKLKILPADEFAFQISKEGSVNLMMEPTCWVVEVDAISEHVETEGKWLIDVAVSFLRLLHVQWDGHFPTVGKIEPHPAKAGIYHREGAMFAGPKAQAGGTWVPAWYEIDSAVAATSTEATFVADAALVFSPPSKSLAERISQGLGWPTRGRQAEDRAERLLYFFTAIEALLSNDDKTAPITQTIARHASVMLTNDNQKREQIAARIKALYTVRSALVHSGNRSVSGSAADETQGLAEVLFHIALTKSDLHSSHATFNNGLASASYGTAWPTPLASVG